MSTKEKCLSISLLLLSAFVMGVLCLQPFGYRVLDGVLDVLRNMLAGVGLGAIMAHILIYRNRKRAERRLDADIERMHQEIAALMEMEHHQRSVDEWEITEEGHEKKTFRH